MSKIYSSLILFLLPLVILGQGFKGKTLSVTPHIGLLYLGPDNNSYYNIFTANLDIEKAFNRNFSAGVYAFSQLNDANISWRRERPNGTETIQGTNTGNGYGFYLKRYFVGRGAIAPLGPFFQYGASIQNYKISNQNGVIYSGLRTYAARVAFGFNWFLGKNALIFGAIEGKYEASFKDRNDVILINETRAINAFESRVLETMPVSIKIGITIPIL